MGIGQRNSGNRKQGVWKDKHGKGEGTKTKSRDVQELPEQGSLARPSEMLS